MEIVLGGLIGLLMAASVWMMLSRDLVKFLFGLILIGNVANLVIFLSGGLTLGAPPLIAGDYGGGAAAETLGEHRGGADTGVDVGEDDSTGTVSDTANPDYANALPQALVLTAIVIGFALVSFTLILAMRTWQALGTTDVDEMVIAERRSGDTWLEGDRLGAVPEAPPASESPS